MEEKTNISELRKLSYKRQPLKSTHLLIAFFAITVMMGFVLVFIEN